MSVPDDGFSEAGGVAPRLDRSALLGICGVFFLSRLLVIGPALLARTILMPGEYLEPGRSWTERFTVWDSNWYLGIAATGYEYDPHGQSAVAFYPLYPLLIRGLGHLGLDGRLAGYAISHAALFAACLFLWRLAALETRSAPTASLAVTFLLLCPGAVWFGLIYTESLFLLTMVGCLLAARRGRWLEAALWGYAAALTRTPGLLLAGFLFLEAVQQRREGRAATTSGVAGRPGWFPLPTTARMALATLAPVLGQLTFLIFLQARFGDWHAQQRTMTAGWFADGPRLPWKALASNWLHNERFYSLTADPTLAVVLVAAVASFWTLRRWGYPALVLALATLYLVSTNGESLLRYLCTAAPVYLVLAQAARRSPLLETTILGFSVAVMVLVSVLLLNGYRMI